MPVSDNLVFREAERSDIRKIARLRALEWETEAYWITRITAYRDGDLDPQHALKPRVIYVAVQGGAIVGCIAGHLTRRYGCDGELEWLNVETDSRGRGVASVLLMTLAAWFTLRKAARICVDVLPTNAVARSFYAHHGAVDLHPHWMVWNDIGTIVKDRPTR